MRNPAEIWWRSTHCIQITGPKLGGLECVEASTCSVSITKTILLGNSIEIDLYCSQERHGRSCKLPIEGLEALSGPQKIEDDGADKFSSFISS